MKLEGEQIEAKLLVEQNQSIRLNAHPHHPLGNQIGKALTRSSARFFGRVMSIARTQVGAGRSTRTPDHGVQACDEPNP